MFGYILKSEFGLQNFLQVYHVNKLYSALIYGMVVVVCEKIRHSMRADKSAFLIKRDSKRTVSCSNLKNWILPAKLLNDKVNQCFCIAFSLKFGSCRYVFDFEYAVAFIG